MIDGETLFACNICNEGVDDEYSIKWQIYDEHEDLTLNIWIVMNILTMKMCEMCESNP